MRRVIVAALEAVCTLLGAIPKWEGGRWYRFGHWGCQLGLASWSDRLDQRWGTGVWGAC